MANTDTSTESATWLLGSYEAEGLERELHAIRVPGEQTLRIIDVLAQTLPEDGDVDERHVEDRVGGLGEAGAIAADYIAVAERIGHPPMPEIWW
jgi:hypothetical protein